MTIGVAGAIPRSEATDVAILYVDDDVDIRTIVAMALALDPTLTVTLAASGPEALALVAAGLRPDAVLLDVMMPGMDGPALHAALRATPSVADVPVIFMTAKGRSADVERYRAQGALGTILKPFDPLTLAAEIRALLRGAG